MEKHILIILGGNSSKNKHWIEMMNRNLKKDFSTLEFHYSHWDENLQDINFEKELTKLSKFISENKISNYSIVAKSAGFILTLKGIENGSLSPRTVVGYGFPIEYSRYRKINLKSLVNKTLIKSNILCVQADEDPQGNIDLTQEHISDIFPIWITKDNTHDYNSFKTMANIAKSFIRIHQPQIEQQVREIDAGSLTDAIKIVSKSPKKFRFNNNWIFDIQKKIFIFSYNKERFILKHGNTYKINKEIENTTKARSLLNKTKIGSRELMVVVPEIYKINSKNSYLVSKYFGPDCNELFYQYLQELLTKEDIIQIIKKINELSINYKDFIPRNTIVKNNKIYLIDWENTIFNNESLGKDLLSKTSIFTSWRQIIYLTKKEFDSIYQVQKELKEDIFLSEYEGIFKEISGSVNKSSSQIQILCYENVIKSTDYTHKHSLIKIDDILHSISGILPIEVEMLLDVILSGGGEKQNEFLFIKLSNIIKVARTMSYMDMNNVKLFIGEEIKKILRQKLANKKINPTESLQFIIKSTSSYFNPTEDYLKKVLHYLK